MNKQVAIAMVTCAVLALVYARLLGQHATIGSFGMTYGMCRLFTDPKSQGYLMDVCGTWRREALFESIAAVLFGASAILYFGRRPAGEP